MTEWLHLLAWCSQMLSRSIEHEMTVETTVKSLGSMYYRFTIGYEIRS